MRARIVGTGSYAPERVVTNREIELMVETTDEWIRTRTGISERRVTTGENPSEMAAKAARAALRSAALAPRDIDLVVVGTVTPEMTFPSTACFVQSQLHIRSGVPVFDVSAACSGFIYALDAADKYIRSGACTNALVIGVDAFSRIVDWKDRSTCILFGDGAGAVALTAHRGRRGILSSRIHSDGRRWEMLYARGPAAASPFERGERGQDPGPLKMQGNETFKIAIKTMRAVCGELLEETGLAMSDVSLVIPHQANIRIIKALSEKLRLAEDRVYSNIERYGNTSAGSIPLALDEAVRDGRIKDGDIVLFVAFGGGLTWGATAVRW